MARKERAVGYLVFERTEDFEQALALWYDNPYGIAAGVLTWGKEAATLFATKTEARDAINRTEYVRRAGRLGLAIDRERAQIDLPEAKFCAVVPVCAARGGKDVRPQE